MAKLSIFGPLTNIQMLIHTFFKGKRVGADSLGNVYYRGKPRKQGGRERRWVIYKDRPEASLVPPEWHGWLHHQTDVVPGNDNPFRKPWQQPHRPNMTGTADAWLPKGHPTRGGARTASSSDYNPWQPPQ